MAKTQPKEAPRRPRTPTEVKILGVLHEQPQDLNTLIKTTGVLVEEIAPFIGRLYDRGEIGIKEGKYHVCSPPYTFLPDTPRELSLVRFLWDDIPKEQHKHYPFSYLENTYIFIGEIPNMPGHCIVAQKNGIFHTGYHTENFKEIPEDET
jgi:hypothetical protein